MTICSYIKHLQSPELYKNRVVLMPQTSGISIETKLTNIRAEIVEELARNALMMTQLRRMQESALALEHMHLQASQMWKSHK